MRAEPGRGYERLVELIIGAKIAAALHVVVDKGLADVLARGPQTAEALAQAVQVPVETLRRFLRALTQVGLFAEVKDGVFANTEVSEHLRSDVPYSLRDMVTVLDDEAVARGWRRLPDVLASGQPAFDAVNGMGFFDWIKSDPVRSAAMASFMGGIYGPQGPKIAAGYPFGQLFDAHRYWGWQWPRLGGDPCGASPAARCPVRSSADRGRCSALSDRARVSCAVRGLSRRFL